MDKLRCIEVFIEVAKAASFSDAARRLNISKGNVTKHVAWLEKSLGTQLLVRTTKSVGMTDAGLALLEKGQTLLEQMSQTEAHLRNSAGGSFGVLRVGTPPSFGAHHLIPVITSFATEYPDIQVSLYLDDGSADLVAQRLDLTIRIAQALEDTSYIRVKLAHIAQCLVAAPAYISRCGMPKTIEDLKEHDCLVNILKSPNGLWHFDNGAESLSVEPRASIRANFGEPLLHAARLGQGISMHPQYMIEDLLKGGELVVVLPDIPPVGLDIYAMYPSQRHLPSRVRIFLEFLKTRISVRRTW
jgi:DNA-binding transcriptional LysR family regulator